MRLLQLLGNFGGRITSRSYFATRSRRVARTCLSASGRWWPLLVPFFASPSLSCWMRPLQHSMPQQTQRYSWPSGVASLVQQHSRLLIGCGPSSTVTASSCLRLARLPSLVLLPNCETARTAFSVGCSRRLATDEPQLCCCCCGCGCIFSR